MRQTDLGDWGVGLPRDEFDNALAAALVLSARRHRTWYHVDADVNARWLLEIMVVTDAEKDYPDSGSSDDWLGRLDRDRRYRPDDAEDDRFGPALQT